MIAIYFVWIHDLLQILHSTYWHEAAEVACNDYKSVHLNHTLVAILEGKIRMAMNYFGT